MWRKASYMYVNEPRMEMEVLPLNVVNMLHVLETSEEEITKYKKSYSMWRWNIFS
jgi:hypothetical protein